MQREEERGSRIKRDKEKKDYSQDKFERVRMKK